MSKLHYHVRNNGDGSASPVFHTSEAAAERAEEEDFEETGEGWGESCVGNVDLEIVDGKICLVESKWVPETRVYVTVRTPLEDM